MQIATVLLFAATALAASTRRPLTLAEQVGQMIMVDINGVVIPGTGQLDVQKFTNLLRAVPVGSIFNSPSSDLRGLRPLDVDQWRALITQIQTVARAEGSKIDLIYGIDSVHGAGYVYNATLFPHQIGIAATFNSEVARLGGQVTASETRAAGLAWNFAPILEVATQPSWPRVYETFGEDPLLASVMGASTVSGMQGRSLHYSEFTVAATMKHFVGYSDSRTGQDRTPAWIPDNVLSEYFLPPFRAALAVNAATVMENYIELNGRPVVASSKYLVDLLRGRLAFPGVLVTDYNEIENLHYFHRAAPTVKEAAYQGIGQTSTDVTMQSSGSNYSFFYDVQQLVQEGRISASRIQESADRIMQLKQDLGLLDSGAPIVPPLPGTCVFGCSEFRAAALSAARESVTLLQNNGVLPLNRQSTRRILVAGPSADSLVLLSGGWTMHWQGAADDAEFTYGHTVFGAVKALFPGATVSKERGCGLTGGCDPAELEAARAAAANSDVVVLCVGEDSYTEKPGDISEMELSSGQLTLVRTLAGTGRPVVLVLVEGRARLLRDTPSLCAAVLMAYLPGPFGGQAIAEILAGDTNPSGRLPISYPSTSGNAPLQYWVKPSQAYTVQWPFGQGLSFSEWDYLDATVTLSNPDPLTGKVDVNVLLRNNGPLAGKEAVLVYVTKLYRQFTPEVKRLRAFVKVSLQPSERQTVPLSFALRELAYYDDNNCEVLEGGEYTLMVGGLQRSFVVPDSHNYPCGAELLMPTPNGGPAGLTLRQPDSNTNDTEKDAGGSARQQSHLDASRMLVTGLGLTLVGAALLFAAVRLSRGGSPLRPVLPTVGPSTRQSGIEPQPLLDVAAQAMASTQR